MNKNQLKELESLLQTRRDLLVQNISAAKDLALRKLSPEQLGEISSARLHPADLGSEMGEQEQELALLEAEQEELSQINDALARLERGEFGRCGDCGEEIGFKRLLAMPFVRRCIQCQRESEGTPPAEMPHGGQKSA